MHGVGACIYCVKSQACSSLLPCQSNDCYHSMRGDRRRGEHQSAPLVLKTSSVVETADRTLLQLQKISMQ